MTDYINYKWYLKEKPKNNVKSTFKNAVMYYKNLKLPEPQTILDVGCANGEFLNFIHKTYPKTSLTGVDIFNELLEKAKTIEPSANYLLAGVPNLKNNLKAKYDVVFGVGLLGIFDDMESALDDLLSVTKRGGALILLSNFNEYNIDARINFRKKVNDKWTDWQKGWNIFSKEAIKEYLKNKVQTIKFTKFDAPFEILPNQEDPIRSWTRKINGKLELTNGLGLIINFNYLIIVK